MLAHTRSRVRVTLGVSHRSLLAAVTATDAAGRSIVVTPRLTGDLQNRSADVGVDPGTIAHSHLAVIERQDHAARARIAALKRASPTLPRSPAEGSGN